MYLINIRRDNYCLRWNDSLTKMKASPFLDTVRDRRADGSESAANRSRWTTTVLIIRKTYTAGVENTYFGTKPLVTDLRAHEFVPSVYQSEREHRRSRGESPLGVRFLPVRVVRELMTGLFGVPIGGVHPDD